MVTNNHVIDNASKIQVSFDKDNKYDAELVGTDPRTDIALLKIKKSQTFPFVKFANATPRVGDWVIAVGNPFGLGGTVTAGIVSAQGRDIGSGPYDYMQIDAAVNRGNSGGPTFNLEGEVVGVNTAIYSPSGGSVGIAFAIPAKTVTEVVDQLKNSGSVSRGWLGVKIQNVDEDTAASLGLGEAKGALVNEVTAGGPAADAGLKNGDTILAVNGSKVADSRDLARQIAGFAPNSKVDVRILRGQKEQTVAVKLGKFPSGKELAKVESGSSPAEPRATEMDQLGLSVAPGSGPDKDSVTITQVEGSSDAAQKGIKSGDVILEIGGLNVKSPEDVVQWRQGSRQARAQGRLDAHQVRRPDAVRRGAVEERLRLLSEACLWARRSAPSWTGRLASRQPTSVAPRAGRPYDRPAATGSGAPNAPARDRRRSGNSPVPAEVVAGKRPRRRYRRGR